MKYKKTRFILLILSISSLFCISLYCGDKEIVLGKEDAWGALQDMKGLKLQKGKEGYFDLLLKEGEYQVDEDTDLLIHFNTQAIKDESSNYLINQGEVQISYDYARYGKGCGVFQGNGGSIFIPQKSTCFSSGAMWNDFSVEFWLYPASLADGESIIVWNGFRMNKDQVIPQRFECKVEERTLVWIFENIFIPVNQDKFSIEVRGINKLLPRQWHHHLLRYDSTYGLLEYLVDDVLEGVIYTTENFHESESIYRPILGQADKEMLVIGKMFTGFMDELRIVKRFIDSPILTKYRGNSGVAISYIFDLGYSGTRIKSIQSIYNKPADSEIFFFFRYSDTYNIRDTLREDWIQFVPGSNFEEYIRGRYLQIRLELFPDGRRENSPNVFTLKIVYEPDVPPISPVGLEIIPGNNRVTLSWLPVNEEDIKGYLVFYGDAPMHYMGTGSDQGDSPIDVGNVTSIEISGLENGKLYFFSIVSYDSSQPPHLSEFFEEKSARPSEVFK